jgi:hypothetical protein
MKKRWFIYGISFILALVLGFVYRGDDMSYMNVIYFPFLGLIDLMMHLSQASTTGNGFAWILLFLVSALPIVIGVIIYKKEMKLFDVSSLWMLSISLGAIFYRSMNLNQVPAWLERIEFFQTVGDIRPLIQMGLINLWLVLFLLYVVAKFFIVKKALSQKVSHVMMMLVVYMILLFAYSWTQKSYSFVSHEQSVLSIENIFNLLVSSLMMVMIEMMIIFVEKIREEDYRESLKKLTLWIKIVSLSILLLSIVKIGILNGYQLIYLGELSDISFTFSLDILSWVLVFFFYGLYHYIVMANGVMEEAELTI